MNHSTRISIDLAKNIFQVCIAKSATQIQSNKAVKRAVIHSYIQQQEPTTIVMEACYSSHYWGRTFQKMGHSVMLIPAQHVKPFVRGNKSDHNDAIAILEASYRPNLRPVMVKSTEQQDIQVLLKSRELLVEQRTATINQLRGLLSEYGITVSKTKQALIRKLPDIIEDASNELTLTMRHYVQDAQDSIQYLNQRVTQVEVRLKNLCQHHESYRRIQTLPGIGPMNAAYFIASIDVTQFKNGRELAAYLGLTPRSSGSGGSTTYSGISKRGNRALRTLLIHGARTVIKWAKTTPHQDQLRIWAQQIDSRIGRPKATVALANKMVRIAWSLLYYQQDYQSNIVSNSVVS